MTIAIPADSVPDVEAVASLPDSLHGRASRAACHPARAIHEDPKWTDIRQLPFLSVFDGTRNRPLAPEGPPNEQ
jgi:hypothetical protein